MDPQLLGFAAGTLTTAAFVPQVVRAWRTRSVRDLSLAMLAIFTAGVVLWLVYGLMVGDRPLVVFNVITLALATVLLRFKLFGVRPER
jgi:MtN3 and saliva related transmembrane protein